MAIGINRYNFKKGATADEKTVQAVKESIAHWERMIDWVSTVVLSNENSPKNADSITMEYNLGENWTGEDCSLCKNFKKCVGCPLEEKYGRCDWGSRNLWKSVQNSWTWQEWYDNAKLFLGQLKSLLTDEERKIIDRPVGKLVIEVLQMKWGKTWRVKEQTCRVDAFNNGKNCFRASSGFKLYSGQFPSNDILEDANLVFVRGQAHEFDNDVHSVVSEGWLSKLRVAVKEYNEYQRKLAGGNVYSYGNLQGDVEIIQ